MWKRNLLAILIFGLLVACKSTPEPTDEVQVEPSSANASDAEQYLIGPGDQVKITVWQHEDLSPAVVVLPDGEISLPLIGEIKVSGQSEHQVATVIREKLREFVRNPEVTVTVLNPSSANFQQRIRVTGAVLRPASVPFRKGMTVLDVVLESGGPNEFSAPNRAKIYRTSATGTQVLKVYLDDILKKGKMNTNYELQPSDVVSVPERLF
jgi:polysaccharide biosynthesis/export protein